MHVFYVFGLATYTDYSFGVCDVVYVIRASLAGAVYYRLWLQYRRRIFQLADNTFSLTCQTGLVFLDRSVYITACI